MSLQRIADELAAIDSAEKPRVVRFDGAATLVGRVAVLPSAFNPPTRAHLQLLETALDLPDVTGAAAMLSTRNVAKSVVGASLADRVGMLLAVREERAWLSVLAVNAARLVDQAAALRQAFPGARFDFVVGFDTLTRLFDPKYYEDMHRELSPFFTSHRVIAANRGAAGIADVVRFVAAAGGPFANCIVPVEIDEDPASLSSTAAREALASQRTPREVPESVVEYIRGRDLYRGAVSQ